MKPYQIITIVALVLVLVFLLVYGLIIVPAQKKSKYNTGTGGTSTGTGTNTGTGGTSTGTGTNTGTGGTSTGTGTNTGQSGTGVQISNQELDNLAVSFYENFKGWIWVGCSPIEQAASLTKSDFERWVNIYKGRYGHSPIVEMDSAWWWATGCTEPEKIVYDRLKNLA